MPYCDVVLTACSHFEINDIYGVCGTMQLQRAELIM